MQTNDENYIDEIEAWSREILKENQNLADKVELLELEKERLTKELQSEKNKTNPL